MSRENSRRIYSSIITALLVASLLTPISLISFVGTAQAQADWWNTDWQHRKAITVDSTKVEADLTNFPVLIDVTDSALASKAQDDGDDIVFTDWAGTKLSHEIEQFDDGLGHLVAWVRANLSSTTDTVIYMYYGNSGATNQEDATGVWDSNYVMVQHLEETALPSSLPWNKYGSNPILNGSKNGFASVFYDSDTSLYHLFCSWGSVLHFTSPDGKTGWLADPENPVLSGNNEGVPMVWKEDGTWYMLYRYGAPDGIGLANSTDATHWTRYEGNPVLQFSPPSFIDPWGVIKVGFTYYLWYNDGFGTGSRAVGLATSTDLKDWTPDPANPIFTGGRYCVFPFKHEGYYYMLVPRYTPHPYGEIELYRDVNPTFYPGSREYLGVTTVPGSEGEWDDRRFDTPCVLTDTIYRDTYLASNNELWVYYAATGTPTGSGADWWTGMIIETNITEALPEPVDAAVYDSTLNDNDGEVIGGLDLNAVGQIDGADDFDGSDSYINCGDGDSLKGMDTLTLEAWFRPEAWNNGIISKWGSWTAGTGGSWIMFQGSAGPIGWGVVTETGWASVMGSTLPAGAWYHLVGVYDGSQIRMYVNGAQDGTPQSISGRIASTDHSCYIGRYTTVRTTGIIDEVRVSNTSRSPDWISTEYNNQHDPSAFYTVGDEETATQTFQIVHDTQTEFAPGTFNQTVLEGTETAPEIRVDTYTEFSWIFEDDDISGWTYLTKGATAVAEESPTGQIHLRGLYDGQESYGLAQRTDVTVPNVFVAEYRVYFDSIEASGVADPMVDQPTGACARIDLQNSFAGFRTDIFTDRMVSFYREGSTGVNYPTIAYFDITTNTSQWYTLRLECNFTDPDLRTQIYRDNAWIGELKADTRNSVSGSLVRAGLAYSRGSLSGTAEFHVDYVKLGTKTTGFYDLGTYTSEILDLSATSFGTLYWTEKPITSPYPWGEWTKYAGNPILDPPHSCLVENMLTDINDPEQKPLLYDGNYWLSYGDFGNLRLANSTDPNLLTWTPHPTPILTPGPGEYYLFSPNIFKDGDTYYLFYDVAMDSPHGSAQRIAYATATSPLGPYTKGPVILDIGAPGDYDEGRVSEPFVFKDGDTYYLFYMGDTYSYGAKEEIALATTSAADFPLGPSGGNWTKYGLILPHNPDPSAWDSGLTADPSVIKVNDTFYMLYTGSYANVAWKLGIASSDSPFGPWTRPNSPNIPLGPPGSWDDNRLVRGAIHYHNGKYVMPYTGNDGSTYRGGIATADPLADEELIEFHTRTSPDGSTWEDWIPVLNDTTIQSTPDRYFQYRATLHKGSSPTLTSVTINYQIAEVPNTPPVASNLAITPSSPYTTDDLVGSYSYYDADGDPESGSEIRWYKDDVLQPAYNDILTVSSASTTPGEEWYFTVRPSDGVDYGELQTSPSATILAPVSYIFSDGFESGDFAKWDSVVATGWRGTYISVGSAQAHHQDYSAETYLSISTHNYAFCRKEGFGEEVLHVRFYLRLDDVLSPGDLVSICEVWDENGFTKASLRIINDDGTNKFQVRHPNGWSWVTSNSAGIAVNADTWYSIEVKIEVADDGEIRVWLDGNERLALTGIDMNNRGSSADRVDIGLRTYTNGVSLTAWYDCIAVSDTYVGPEEETPPPPDTAPPTYSNVGANTTAPGEPCKFHARWTDNVALSGYIFSTNNTGTWLNSTWTPLAGISDWSNTTENLNPETGAIVQYRFYCNDTSDNWNSTPTHSLTTSTPVEQLFSVSSNSTVSQIAFNATAKEILFTVEGPSGTTGQLNIFLSNKLISDVTGLKIYFDGAEKEYEVNLTDDGWIIHLTYLHSTHTVKIILSPPPSSANTPAEPLTVLVVYLIIALAAASTAIALRKKKITNTTPTFL